MISFRLTIHPIQFQSYKSESIIMEPSGKVMDKIAFQGQDLCFSCFAENAS